MARKSVKSKSAKLAFVRMQEQMTKFSPHQNRLTAAGKVGEGVDGEFRDSETAVKLNESGSFS